jgi:hypothetical protein
MSSAERAANLSGCVARPKAREIGLIGFAAQIRRSSPTGSYVMETGEHREPCESRGSCTVLGARGGEIPPRDSSRTAAPPRWKRGRSTPETCRAHSWITEREPAPQCSGYEPAPDGHQKLISRVSAIVKTNADNRMALKFVKYLYRSALECSFSQPGRKMPGILFLNTTRCNQRPDADYPRLIRLHVGAISLRRQARGG